MRKDNDWAFVAACPAFGRSHSCALCRYAAWDGQTSTQWNFLRCVRRGSLCSSHANLFRNTKNPQRAQRREVTKCMLSHTITFTVNKMGLLFHPQLSPALKAIFIFLLLFPSFAFAQTIGGNAAYNFLKLPASPIVTAAGGVNISYAAHDVSLSANNPALLNPLLHSQLNASFNAFIGGIRTSSLTGAFYSGKLNTTFGGHIYFVDYGSIAATDAAGNVSGEFHPREYVAQFSAAKKYLERWTYGGTVKFIASSYGQYLSTAIAVDIGLLYTDSVRSFTAGLAAKNMGAQLKTFTGTAEDLPFDLEMGITKRLSRAPFGFFLYGAPSSPL